MSAPGYAVVGVYWAGETSPSLLCVDGKVVIFDTPAIANQFLPRLGAGRVCLQSEDGQTASFAPLAQAGVNRAVTLTEYDPYDAPLGLHITLPQSGKKRVGSESRRREWRHHIIWSQALTGDRN